MPQYEKMPQYEFEVIVYGKLEEENQAAVRRSIGELEKLLSSLSWVSSVHCTCLSLEGYFEDTMEVPYQEGKDD